jgi:starvation-inducible DNA-binding protein
MPTKTEALVRFTSGIGLPDNAKSKLIDLLNARLADTIDMKTQIKHAHLERQGSSPLSVASALRRSCFPGGRRSRPDRRTRPPVRRSRPRHPHRRQDHRRRACASDGCRLSALANASRDAIDEDDKLGDKATSDKFTEIVRATEKDLWFLEAHIQAA